MKLSLSMIDLHCLFKAVMAIINYNGLAILSPEFKKFAALFFNKDKK